jgi:branched-chain amino acid transport system substrate-binding protein
MRMLAWTMAGALLCAALGAAATAAEPVKIGVVLPLSGNAAGAGNAARAAIELGAEIVNNPHPELKGLPLAEGAGLPGLGGAKIELVFADHQGNPSAGQSQALRLITGDKVVALLGAYQSSVTATASAVAERYGVPFVCGDSVALALTQRGFTWFFRVTPNANDFANIYMQFLADMRKAGRKVDNIAILNENTEYGTSVADLLLTAAKWHGFAVVAQIPYSANASDVAPQLLQIKQLKPEVVIFVSYTADAILYMKTLKDLDYLPAMIIGDDSGFSDPSFLLAVAGTAEGVMNRSAWDIGKPGSITYRINEMYKAKTGRDLDDTSGRDMQGFLVLADAINRAGSTDPAKIQKALRETSLRPEQLMMGYHGVKFDTGGQNTEGASYLIQLQGQEYKAVWPETAASAPLEWPMKGWRK